MAEHYDLLIRHGTCVLPWAQEAIDVGARNGRIVALGVDGTATAATVIDARGLHVLPGLIDPHVHFRDPGDKSVESIPTGSLGAVLGVRGSEARVGLPAPSLSDSLRATVGTFLAIAAGPHRLVGVVTEVDGNADRDDSRFGAIARVDLMGEIKQDAGAEHFVRGVSAYPAIGDSARIINPSGRSAKPAPGAAARLIRFQNRSSRALAASRPPSISPEASSAALTAPALTPLIASNAISGSSSSRSSAPHVKAPNDPPPCRASDSRRGGHAGAAAARPRRSRVRSKKRIAPFGSAMKIGIRIVRRNMKAARPTAEA